MEKDKKNAKENYSPGEVIKKLMEKSSLSHQEIKKLLSDGSILNGIPLDLYLKLFPDKKNYQD